MKKKILFLTLLLALAFTTSLYAIDITIDGEKVIFDNATGEPFVDENYRTQVPLRTTMESFGATINWDNENRIASVKKYGIEVKVPVNEVSMEKPYIFINNMKVEIDTSAVIKEGRTYLPIRAVVEAFGATVEWDSATQTIIIDKSIAGKQIQGELEKEIEDNNIISYEDFRDMFTYDGSAVNEMIWINATYKGKMDKDEFSEFWTELPDKYKEYYMTEIAEEKQSKNPEYDAYLNFAFGRNGVFVSYSLGRSNCDINGNASAGVENPFNEIKINPLN